MIFFYDFARIKTHRTSTYPIKIPSYRTTPCRTGTHLLMTACNKKNTMFFNKRLTKFVYRHISCGKREFRFFRNIPLWHGWQSWLLCMTGPVQGCPPFIGAGLVQDLVLFWPWANCPGHLHSDHWDHWDQPPFSVKNTNRNRDWSKPINKSNKQLKNR